MFRKSIVIVTRTIQNPLSIHPLYSQVPTGRGCGNVFYRIKRRNSSDTKGKENPLTDSKSKTFSSKEEQPHENPGNTAEAIAYATKHYTQEFNRTLNDLERTLMDRIHETNTRRFRIILISVSAFLAWIIAVFGRNIRKKLTDETAELARETLENESLKIQTKELATAVVQTILNDKDVMKNAAEFLRDASGAAETKMALLSLTLHVLQHPQSLHELTNLVKKVLATLTADKETINQVAGLLSSALQDPQLGSAVARLAQNLLRNPEVLRALTDATLLVLQQPEVQRATTSLLAVSSQEVLDDRQVWSQVRDFVTEVMGDDRLQREGGNALWNSVSHAVMPGLQRITGLALIAVSVGVLRIMLSPF